LASGSILASKGLHHLAVYIPLPGLVKAVEDKYQKDQDADNQTHENAPSNI
jgi:hypothetical protein